MLEAPLDPGRRIFDPHLHHWHIQPSPGALQEPRRFPETFGADRSMFESNYPPDRAAASYGTIWNAFKCIAAALSEDERDWLFHGTAAETYRMGPAAGA